MYYSLNTSDICPLKPDMSTISISNASPTLHDTSPVVNQVSDFPNKSSIYNKFFLKYPLVSYSIVILYILFVKWIGPAIMRKRKPYSLKKVLIVYNLFQALANLYILRNGIFLIRLYWDSRCAFRKNPNFEEMLETSMMYGYDVYIIKFLDLLDTVFFVLRKKQNQVSFLHVFHHAGMCLLFAWGFKKLYLILGFYVYIALFVNTAVHVIMYTYYGLAAIGPQMQKYLWWKKHLTLIQIGQLLFIIFYQIYGILTGCEEFGKLELYILFYLTVTVLFFLKFYRNYKNT
ncbi:unnamed protein product [Larinioides sclopetarius]|uniref:Elongation of very long chain fatty acids protein n=1 Tax=Larinioides sclopetarius TaxID=280406 RepID=A0AAV2ASP1_9ARAC